MSHAEHLVYLHEKGFAQIDAGHWSVHLPSIERLGFCDLMQSVEGLWRAAYFDENATGSTWEGPLFDNPAAALVHAELAEWGQS